MTNFNQLHIGTPQYIQFLERIKEEFPSTWKALSHTDNSPLGIMSLEVEEGKVFLCITYLEKKGNLFKSVFNKYMEFDGHLVELTESPIFGY